jgi:hypothetical protein
MGGRQLRRIGDGCWLHRARARSPSPELLRVGLFRWRGCSCRVDVGVEIGPHEVQTKRALVMRLLLSQGPVESAVTDRRITFPVGENDLPGGFAATGRRRLPRSTGRTIRRGWRRAIGSAIAAGVGASCLPEELLRQSVVLQRDGPVWTEGREITYRCHG